MNDNEAIALLDAMQNGDNEGVHSEADDILLALVSPAVRDAYVRLVDRCSWWAWA